MQIIQTNEHDLTIKMLQHADIDAVSQLHSKCFARGWSSAEIHELLHAGAEGVCVWRDITKHHLSNINIKLLGFGLWRATAEEAELLTIGIEANYRRRRLASDLLQYITTKLQKQNVNKLFIEVSANNNAAISLYKKHNFKQISMRKNYYRSENRNNPPNALILCKQL